MTYEAQFKVGVDLTRFPAARSGQKKPAAAGLFHFFFEELVDGVLKRFDGLY